MATASANSEWSQWYLATDSGNALVAFSSCLGVSISMEGEVVNEPIEQGSFASYNKTISPISINATVAKQGTAAELSETLETIRTLQTGVTLFSFVTPEREFRSLTLETFDYERQREGGLNLLTLNLSMKEVKQVNVSYTSVALPASSVKDPSAADAEQGGQKTAKRTSSLKTLWNGGQ